MATPPPPPQRAYRALCPNCGAPVEFASAASASAVCGYCRSTLLRDGDTLRRIGLAGELFDDHSPLRLGAAGRHQGATFTLVGRLQIGYDGGTWNEWHALFDTGRSGWLSEDNGRYVMAFDAPAADLPPVSDLHAGERRLVDGRAWTVASVTRVRLIAAEGELPYPPPLDRDYTVADLRNEQGEVATIDDGDPAAPHWSVGRSVALSELAMTGLADAPERTLSARGVSCPECGSAVEVKLATTQSVTCPQCQAVIDVSQGAGADLRHYAQNNAGLSGIEPLLPLGGTGSLALGTADPVDWQVVGYLERCDIPETEDDEQSFWREYLLYHRTAGFAFLVDAEDGWSWVVPLTGAPVVRGGGERASYGGVDYRRRWSYSAKTTYVLGEFYWRVARDQRSRNADYEGTGAHADKRLNREQTGQEVVWSGGETIYADAVAAAFRIPPERRGALQRDVRPTGVSPRSILNVALLVVIAIVLLVSLVRCGDDDCEPLRRTFGEASSEYRQCVRDRRGGAGGFGTGGGSYGGGSYGGHK